MPEKCGVCFWGTFFQCTTPTSMEIMLLLPYAWQHEASCTDTMNISYILSYFYATKSDSPQYVHVWQYVSTSSLMTASVNGFFCVWNSYVVCLINDHAVIFRRRDNLYKLREGLNIPY